MNKTGRVKWFDKDKGYGFIVNDDGHDVFVHYTSITGRDRTLEQDEPVSFEQVLSPRGLNARSVTRANAGERR